MACTDRVAPTHKTRELQLRRLLLLRVQKLDNGLAVMVVIRVLGELKSITRASQFHIENFTDAWLIPVDLGSTCQ